METDFEEKYTLEVKEWPICNTCGSRKEGDECTNRQCGIIHIEPKGDDTF